MNEQVLKDQLFQQFEVEMNKQLRALKVARRGGKISSSDEMYFKGAESGIAVAVQTLREQVTP